MWVNVKFSIRISKTNVIKMCAKCGKTVVFSLAGLVQTVPHFHLNSLFKFQGMSFALSLSLGASNMVKAQVIIE